MEKTDFREAILDLFDYFRLKIKDEVIDVWFDKLYFIPAEALSSIVSQFESMENLPRNMPRQFKIFWREWKKEHPDKMTGEKEACNDCCDEGFFIISKVWPGHDIPAQMMVICKKCKNLKRLINRNTIFYEKPLGHSHSSKIAVKTREQLMLAGFKIIHPQLTKDQINNRVPTKQQVGKFVDKLKNMDFNIVKGFERRYKKPPEFEDEIPF